MNSTIRQNRIFKSLFVLTLLLFLSVSTNAQVTDVPPAGFDVIITNTGKIIHGKVTEVGLYVIRYKRTDIPDGPVYEILKKDVYAISYRNQLSEYLIPVDSTVFVKKGLEVKPIPKRGASILVLSKPTPITDTWYSNVRQGEIRLGFGFIRNYSKVKEVENYTRKLSFPAVHIAYLFPLRKSLDIGLVMGWASFEYKDKSFSEYDQLSTNRNITESLFSIAAIGKYSYEMDLFRPYLQAGIGYTNSSVRTEGEVTFTDDNRTILIQGGSRSGNFVIPIRFGTDIRLNNTFSAYTDIGLGLTLIQLGCVIKIGKE
ncbi:MAG: hypothetical protein Q8909_18030 [Bacteroidota bacterium]|nr:hypothetical protein [Bacteroidota bacterium]